MKKIRVALLFGGQSAEHEVSINSARNIYRALNKERYEITLIGIDREGNWHIDLSQQLLNDTSFSTISTRSEEEGRDHLVASDTNDLSVAFLVRDDKPFDVVFPVLHGPNGEDGTIQGFLKLANIPFVGAGVLGSAVGMDKDVMKRLLRDAGIPIAKFVVLNNPIVIPDLIRNPDSCLRRNDNEYSFEQVVRQLGLPLFVKPANLGSSVGVSKVTNEEEFRDAIEKAFSFDTKIIIEEGIIGREIELAVLGNDQPEVSIAGEIKPRNHDFYDYEAKYLDENGAEIIIPAEVTKRELDDLQHLAIKTFQTLCCSGMARVDFFLTKEGKVYVNEINTIPGFTNSSMYPKLWEATGISYPDLIERLITLAIERHTNNATLQSTRY